MILQHISTFIELYFFWNYTIPSFTWRNYNHLLKVNLYVIFIKYFFMISLPALRLPTFNEIAWICQPWSKQWATRQSSAKSDPKFSRKLVCVRKLYHSNLNTILCLDLCTWYVRKFRLLSSLNILFAKFNCCWVTNVFYFVLSHCICLIN